MATPEEGKSTTTALAKVAWDFLSIDVRHAGSIDRDVEVARSVRRTRPFLLDHRDGPRWREFAAVAASVLRSERRKKRGATKDSLPVSAPAPSAPEAGSPSNADEVAET